MEKKHTHIKLDTESESIVKKKKKNKPHGFWGCLLEALEAPARTRPSPVAGKVFELASNIPLKMGHASFSKISRVSRTVDGSSGGGWCCCSTSFSVRDSSPRRKSKSISIALRSRLEFAHFEQLIVRLITGGREILREFERFLCAGLD